MTNIQFNNAKTIPRVYTPQENPGPNGLNSVSSVEEQHALQCTGSWGSPSYANLNSHTGKQGTMFTSVIIMRYLYHEVIREFYRISNSGASQHQPLKYSTVLRFTILYMSYVNYIRDCKTLTILQQSIDITRPRTVIALPLPFTLNFSLKMTAVIHYYTDYYK